MCQGDGGKRPQGIIPLDAIAITITLAGDGSYAGVAPCGTALTARHAAVLAQTANLRATGVTVAFDPDDAGQRAAVRAYQVLVPLTEKMAAITLPAGQDPASILAACGPALAGILNSRARPLPDLVVNAECRQWGHRLREAEGRIGALRAAAPLIAAMPTPHVARQVARLAAILRLDHATVTEAVTDALTELMSARPDDASPAAKSHAAEVRGPPTAAIQAARLDHAAEVRQEPSARAHPLHIPAPGRRASPSPDGLTGRRIRS